MPDSVSISIEQAPLDWALPVRKEQSLRPPFRVSVVMKSAQPVSMPLQVTPQVLTEEEYKHSTPALLDYHLDTPALNNACRHACSILLHESDAVFNASRACGCMYSVTCRACASAHMHACGVHGFLHCSRDLDAHAQSRQGMPFPAQRGQHELHLQRGRPCRGPGSAASPL